MKPFAIASFFMMFCFSACAQETGKPVDYANPQVGDYIEVHNYLADWCSVTMRPDLVFGLDMALDSLFRLPQFKFRLEVHTDCRASHPYNDTFSQARADTMLKYILYRGFPSWRITAKGMGERMLLNPKCSCDMTDAITRTCNEREHQLNRRVVIRLVKEIKWTGQEPFNLKFPSPGQFLSFPITYFEGTDNTRGVRIELQEALDTMSDAYVTLYVIPKKEPFLFKKGYKKKTLAEAYDYKTFSPVPSRVRVEYLSPKKQKFGVKAGYVLQLDSVLNRKKIMDEIGLKGDTNILVSDVSYMPEKELKFEPFPTGGVGINPYVLSKTAYRLLVITTDFPEQIRYFLYDRDKWCVANQDTILSEVFEGYVEAMQAYWQIEGRIVSIEYKYVPGLNRPYMYILQPVTKPD